jgi:nitrite reductase/ring-hydroxylating ferredoxin subunit
MLENENKMTEGYVAVSAGTLQNGEKRLVQVAGRDVCLIMTEGKLYALADSCTHAGCSLTDAGEAEGGEIECACHGSRFDLATGAVKSPPADAPLERFDVRVENDRILIRAV